MPPRLLQGRCVVAGTAAGPALVSAQPISLWGGLDPRTGEIIDRRHDRTRQVVTGRVLLYPHGRGSSTGSAILLEAIRAGTAPAAIVNLATDPIAALGAIVADELYGRTVPIVVLTASDFASIRDGDHVSIAPDGAVRVEPAEQT
jgi:predicted aconitase with swiveling domain